MRSLLICGLSAVLLAPTAPGSTLLQLSLDDMVRQSTVIVKGKTQRTNFAFRGSMIYTHYQVQVSETWKGRAAGQLDIVVPGGVANGTQQSFAGAPALVDGQDYVLFLWTSKSGLTQVIGLSQGLFQVAPNATGELMVLRGAATERMLDASGKEVTDSDFQMRLNDFRQRVQKTLGGGQ